MRDIIILWIVDIILFLFVPCRKSILTGRRWHTLPLMISMQLRDGQSVQRQIRTSTPDTACNLFLQADHTYTAHYGADVSEVITQLNNHVSAVNDIYISTDFSPSDGTIAIRGINFVVTRIRVSESQGDTCIIYTVCPPQKNYNQSFSTNSFQNCELIWIWFSIMKLSLIICISAKTPSNLVR